MPMGDVAVIAVAAARDLGARGRREERAHLFSGKPENVTPTLVRLATETRALSQ